MTRIRATTAGGGIQSGYELIEEIIVTSAVQTQDFASALDGNNDGGYIIEIYLVNDDGSTSVVNLRINGADWAVTRSRLRQTGISVAGLRDNNINFGAPITSSEATFIIRIPKSSTGNRRHVISEVAEDSTNVVQSKYTFDVTTPTSATNITSLGIASTVVSGIGVDTVMRLYKIN